MVPTIPVASTPSMAILQELELKFIAALGQKRFERLCVDNLTLNIAFAANPLADLAGVQEEETFKKLMQDIHSAILPSRVCFIFQKVFSLHFNLKDQKAFEEKRMRYMEAMESKFIASLERQAQKLTCIDAVRERDLEKLKNLRSMGSPWGYKIMESAKHMAEDPSASIFEVSESKEILNWIDTQFDLEEMQKLEKQLEEMGVKGDELKMMHYSHAGMAQRFVEDRMSYIFLPFYGAIQMEWRPSRNNAILEACFDKALEIYGKIGMPDWINQKNIRLKQIRELQIEGLNLLIDKLGALNKETKAV